MKPVIHGRQYLTAFVLLNRNFRKPYVGDYSQALANFLF